MYADNDDDILAGNVSLSSYFSIPFWFHFFYSNDQQVNPVKK